MIKRISADQARAASTFAITQAKEKIAKAQARNLLVQKTWDFQEKKILTCALEGHLFCKFPKRLSNGGKLEDLGFLIYKMQVEVSSEDFIEILQHDNPVHKILNLHIAEFIELSLHNFEDKENYQNYIYDKFNYFLTRAQSGLDISDSRSLIYYMNSEGYAKFGTDGAWNSFSNELQHINRTMNEYLSGKVSKIKDQSALKSYVLSLLPVSSIQLSDINEDLIELRNDYSYFKVAWGAHNSRIKNSKELINANKMSSLSSKEGQIFLGKIFSKIEGETRSGKTSALLRFAHRDEFLEFSGKTKINGIDIVDMEKILLLNGYSVKSKQDEYGTLQVDW